MNWILAGILLVTLVQLALIGWFLLRFRLFVREIVSFVASPDGKAPCPLSVIADSFIARLVERFKVTLMGFKSGESRAEQAALAGLAEDVANQESPLLAAGLSAFPSLKKSILKNPALVQFLLSKLGGNSKPADGGNSNTDYAQRLGKFGG